MLCFAHTWQFVQCRSTDFFMPFQWYLFLTNADVHLNPLWPDLSCAKMRRQSFRMSGTTIGVYSSPLLKIFLLRMSPSMMYAFLSSLLFFHCFLSCCVWVTFLKFH